MTLRRISVLKNELVYHDGVYVGTLYWAGLANHVTFSEKELANLVRMGVPFSRRIGESLLIRDDAKVPAIAERFPGWLTEPTSETRLRQTPWIYEWNDSNGTRMFRIYKHPDERYVAFSLRFKKLIDDAKLFQSEEGPITVVVDGIQIGVVMPARLEIDSLLEIGLPVGGTE